MTKRSSHALILAVVWLVSGFTGDAGASQTASGSQSMPYRFEVPPSAAGPSRRIEIKKNGILIGTLEIPSSVGLSVEPKEQSLEALKASGNGPAVELATNSDILVGPHAPTDQLASIRVSGATVALIQPRR